MTTKPMEVFIDCEWNSYGGALADARAIRDHYLTMMGDA